MITSLDSEYKATRLIKQGTIRLKEPFAELAAWIANMWDVAVLNVVYSPANDLHAPRLQVILEHEQDVNTFRDGYNFDARKQQAIKEHFIEIVDRQLTHGYDVKGLFVVFAAFAPVAMTVADGKLAKQQVEALKDRIANPDLWLIHRLFGRVTFMFYTDEQAARHEAHGMKQEYAHKYFEILKPHDEFGYLSVENFTVNFDSKEHFSKEYQGSWFGYDR